MPKALPSEAKTHHKTPPGKPHRTTLALLVAAVLGLHLGLLSNWTSQAEPPPTGLPASPNAPPAQATATADSPQLPQQAEPPSGAPTSSSSITQVRWIVAAPTAASAYEPGTVEQPTPATKPPPPATPTPAQRQTHPAPPSEPIEAAAPALAQAQEPAASTAAQPDSGQAAAAPVVVAQATMTVPTTPLNATPNASVPPAQSNQPMPPASPPASAQLVYEVSGNARGLNYNARAMLDWRHVDGQYSARMELRMPLLGSRVQTSVGRVEPSGLLPERFADKSRSERAAHFDHTRQTIRFSNNQPDATLQPGAQDRLSLFMQLAGLLRAQPAAYPAGQLISLQVAGTSDAETWRFRVGEEETLALPAGPLQARHLVREPREPRDNRVDIWLAPELAYLPVRIRITQDNGDQIDQQLSQMP